jgi:hypothetical protein
VAELLMKQQQITCNAMVLTFWLQAPDLALHPHVSAPGAFVRVVTQDDYSTRVSGTSFSAPFISGSLALWLQQRQQAAGVAGQELDPKTVNQQAALSGLVVTAQPVPDSIRAGFVEPVAKVGAGRIFAVVEPSTSSDISLTTVMVIVKGVVLGEGAILWGRKGSSAPCK